MELDSVMDVKEVRCESIRCQLLFTGVPQRCSPMGVTVRVMQTVLNITQLLYYRSSQSASMNVSTVTVPWSQATHMHAQQAAGASLLNGVYQQTR